MSFKFKSTETVSDRLFQICRLNNITKGIDIAAFCNVSESLVSGWRAGRTQPNILQIKELSKNINQLSENKTLRVGHFYDDQLFKEYINMRIKKNER